MQVVDIERKFKYNSVTLPDPNPDMSADEVREMYAAQYPELLNAVVEGPVTKDNVSTYTFIRAAGAKGTKDAKIGTSHAAIGAAEVVRRHSQPVPADSVDALSDAALQGRFERASKEIAQVATAKGSSGTAMLMPSQAFGLWG
jgi:PRTRC genetic system protein C